MRGHLGFKVKSKAFTPYAVVLTTAGEWLTYTVPPGAMTMTVWAVGAGGDVGGAGPVGAGGVAWRTYGVLAGQQLSYNSNATRNPYPQVANLGILGHASSSFLGSTMLAHPGRPTAQSLAATQEYFGVDISGYAWGGVSGDYSQYANGGEALATNLGQMYGGAIGAVDRTNGYFLTNRTPAGSAVASLKNAVALAGYKVTEDDDPYQPAFGSGGYSSSSGYGGSYDSLAPSEFGGGSAVVGVQPSGRGCVVLYFE